MDLVAVRNSLTQAVLEYQAKVVEYHQDQQGQKVSCVGNVMYWLRRRARSRPFFGRPRTYVVETNENYEYHKPTEPQKEILYKVHTRKDSDIYPALPSANKPDSSKTAPARAIGDPHKQELENINKKLKENVELTEREQELRWADIKDSLGTIEGVTQLINDGRFLAEIVERYQGLMLEVGLLGGKVAHSVGLDLTVKGRVVYFDPDFFEVEMELAKFQTWIMQGWPKWQLGFTNYLAPHFFQKEEGQTISAPQFVLPPPPLSMGPPPPPPVEND